MEKKNERAIPPKDSPPSQEDAKETSPKKLEIKEDDRPIDKYFWFNLSRTWVSGGIQNVIEICDRLRAAVVWFLGLGSSGFLLSLAVGSGPFKELNLSLMIIPVVLSILSYGFAILGQTIAIHKVFKPNEDATIREAYNSVMNASKRYIIVSAAAFLFAIVSIPFIVSHAQSEKKITQANTPKDDPIIQGTFVLKDTLIGGTNKQYISKVNISGTLKGISKVRILLESGKGQLSRSVINDLQVFPDEKTGLLFLDIPFKTLRIVSGEDQFYASAEYSTGKPGHLMRQTRLITATK